jgi:hypothetical protein
MSTVSPFTLTTFLLFSVAPTFALLDYGLSHDQLALIRQQLDTFAQARYFLSISMLFSSQSIPCSPPGHANLLSPSPCQALPLAKSPCMVRGKQARIAFIGIYLGRLLTLLAFTAGNTELHQRLTLRLISLSSQSTVLVPFLRLML